MSISLAPNASPPSQQLICQSNSYVSPYCWTGSATSIPVSYCGNPQEWDATLLSSNAPNPCTAGRPINCTRKASTAGLGNRLQCCFQDYYNDPSDVNRCFTNVDDAGNPRAADQQSFTCPSADAGPEAPNTRSLLSSNCSDEFTRWCLGQDREGNQLDGVDFLNRWTEDNNSAPGGISCPQLITRRLRGVLQEQYVPYSGGINRQTPFTYSATGFAWSSDLIERAVQYYTTELGLTLGALPGDPGYNRWQDTLFNQICAAYPGVCDAGLSHACENYSIDNLLAVPSLVPWCGCHLSPSEYDEYALRYGIEDVCTPVCNRADTLPRGGVAGSVNNCSKRVCMIDDVAISLYNTTGEGLQLNQVCQGCEDGGCTCVVSNQELDLQNSLVGGNVIPVNQVCSWYSCTQNGEQTDCTAQPPDPVTLERSVNRTPGLVLALLALAVVILGLALLWYFTRRA